MGFNSFINIPDYRTRKRRALPYGDPTENAPMDLTVPTNLPTPVNPMPYAPPQGGGKLDFLARLLEAASSGYAVSQSDNPAQTIMQQMMQRRQEAMQKQQQEYEMLRQQNEQTFRQQMQSTELAARKQEQQVDIGAKKSLQESEQKHQILLNSTEFAQRRDLQKQHEDATVALTKLEQAFKVGPEMQSNLDLQKQLIAARDAGDLKQMQIKTVMAALLSSSKYHQAAPIGRVLEIVRKMQNDEVLTADNTADIDRAIRVQGIVNRMGQAQAVRLGKLTEKNFSQLENDRNETLKFAVTHAWTPATNPVTGLPLRDAQGKLVMMYNPTEAGQYVDNVMNMFEEHTKYGERAKALYGKQPYDIQGAAGVGTGGNPAQSENTVIQNVNNFLNSGGNPTSINLDAIQDPKLKARIRGEIDAFKKRSSRYSVKAFK